MQLVPLVMLKYSSIYPSVTNLLGQLRCPMYAYFHYTASSGEASKAGNKLILTLESIYIWLIKL